MVLEIRNDLEYLKQTDVCKLIESCFKGHQWIPVEDTFSDSENRIGLFGELVPNDSIDMCLSKKGWDLTRADLGPECSVEKVDGKVRISYSRLSAFSDIEPIVIPRNFFDLLQGYYQLSEEYILFHNLYHDTTNGTYLKLNESGNTTPAARIQNGEFQISRKLLRNYLGIKGYALIVQFNSARYSSIPLSQIAPENRTREHRTKDFSYSMNIVEDEFETKPGSKTLSLLFGKSVVRGFPPDKCNYGFFRDDEDYPEYIIGVDEEDEDILASCDPEQLDRGKPGARSFLTPVYFSHDVLQKYYADESKYSVEDGYLGCGTLWGLRMDNNNPDYVMVYLGDLSGNLPEDERGYWRAFNISPQGGMSRTSYRRNVLAEFADPEKEDLRFKLVYNRFGRLWEKVKGWPLYLPLNDDDKHILQHLRVPMKNVSSEFDQQMLYLTKLLIDSLNEKQISESIANCPESSKGITKFEILLTEMKYSNAGVFIGFLRGMQHVRSRGVAHRKGKSYDKSLMQLNIDKLDYINSFARILLEASNHITKLEKYVGNKEQTLNA